MGELRFTYNGDPSRSDRDAVRFYVGDTNGQRPLLDDREVDFALSANPNPMIAAAVLAEHLMGVFSREADVTVGPVSKKMSHVADAFKKKADQLRHDACKRAGVSFPAISVSDKRALEDNSDLVRPSFLVGQFDNPFATQLNDALDEADFNGF